jgi:hypothetical protein
VARFRASNQSITKMKSPSPQLTALSRILTLSTLVSILLLARPSHGLSVAPRGLGQKVKSAVKDFCGVPSASTHPAHGEWYGPENYENSAGRFVRGENIRASKAGEEDVAPAVQAQNVIPHDPMYHWEQRTLMFGDLPGRAAVSIPDGCGAAIIVSEKGMWSITFPKSAFLAGSLFKQAVESLPGHMPAFLKPGSDEGKGKTVVPAPNHRPGTSASIKARNGDGSKAKAEGGIELQKLNSQGKKTTSPSASPVTAGDSHPHIIIVTPGNLAKEPSTSNVGTVMRDAASKALGGGAHESSVLRYSVQTDINGNCAVHLKVLLQYKPAKAAGGQGSWRFWVSDMERERLDEAKKGISKKAELEVEKSFVVHESHQVLRGHFHPVAGALPAKPAQAHVAH